MWAKGLAAGALATLALLATACTGDGPAVETTSTMAESVASTAASVGCSTEGLEMASEPRDNLSTEAETTRLALIEAALRCDFGALAAMASAGSEPFQSDAGDDLVAAWAEQEAAGEEPMRILVVLLRGTMGTVAAGNIEYRFPSAAGFSDWAEVPESLRQKLEPLYTDADWDRFEAAGVYNGHRTVISDSGEWLSFILAAG